MVSQTFFWKDAREQNTPGSCSLVIASGIQAETTTLEPAKDNTLYEDAGGGLSNGAGTEVSLTLNMSRDHIRCADG